MVETKSSFSYFPLYFPGSQMGAKFMVSPQEMLTKKSIEDVGNNGPDTNNCILYHWIL